MTNAELTAKLQEAAAALTDAAAKLQTAQTDIAAVAANLPADPPPVVLAPPPPTGLAATAGNAQVFLSWNLSNGATSYNVKRKTTGAFATIASPTAGTFTDSTAPNGTLCTYAVSATNTGGTSADSSSASATPQAPSTGVKMAIGTQFWHAGWAPDGNTFKSGAVFDGTSNPFHPTLIADLKLYSGPLRAMDFLAQVQTTVSSWAGRTKLTDPLSVQTSDKGICPELFVTLCNATGRDAWVTIPARTQVGRQANDYALQYATYIFNHLDASLKCYVEFANETWNGGPGGGPGSNIAGYCITQGTNLGLAGDQYEKGFRYHAVAALQCHKAFESVFGVGSPRLVKVLAGQRGNTWLCDVHKEQYLAEGGRVDGVLYAIAPYFGSGSTTVAAMDADLTAMLKDDFVPVLKQAALNGFIPGCYEGGSERFATGAPALSANVAMTTMYAKLLDTAAANGCKVFCLYLHLSPNTGNEAWGILKAHGDWTTPKAVAVLAAIAKYR